MLQPPGPQAWKADSSTRAGSAFCPRDHSVVSQAGHSLALPLPINVNMEEILRFKGRASKRPPILSLPFFLLGTNPNFIAKNHISLLPLHVSASVYALASNVYTELVDGMRQGY